MNTQVSVLNTAIYWQGGVKHKIELAKKTDNISKSAYYS